MLPEIIIFKKKTMENTIEINNQKIFVKGCELLKKFKSREDRFNFLHELSKFFLVL